MPDRNDTVADGGPTRETGDPRADVGGRSAGVVFVGGVATASDTPFAGPAEATLEVRGVPVPARPTVRAAPRVERDAHPWLRRFILLVATVQVVAAAFLVASWRERVAAAEAFRADPCTRTPDPGRCANVEGATIAAVLRSGPQGGDVLVVLRGRFGDQVADLPSPATAGALRIGESVVVVEAGGRPATIVVPASDAGGYDHRLVTTANPGVDVDVPLAAAELLGSCALACVATVGPVRRRRFSLASALGDRRLRLLLYAFCVAQGLDVLTSIAGRHHQLVEGVALSRAVVDRWGDGGFGLVKLPALLLVLVGVARLPRKYALPLLWAATAAMIVVVLDNLALLARA